jgi:hypothetical protein
MSATIQDDRAHANRWARSAAHAKLAMAVKERLVRGHHDGLAVNKVVGQGLAGLVGDRSNAQCLRLVQRLAHQLTVRSQIEHRLVAFVQG